MRLNTHFCTFFKQLSAIVAFLAIGHVYAEAPGINRAPANFVPDDDMIVVPLIIERNFYDDFNEKHEAKFKQSRQKLENWIVQEQYAVDHGLEDAGFIELPTASDKEKFLKRNYLRFIQTDVQKANNETLQGLVNSWTAEDEINSIQNTEQQGEFIVRAKKSRGQKVVQAKKTIKVGKSKFKFNIQPRLEQGMIIVRLKSKFIDVRAWLGVNGKQEVLLKKKFKSTGTKLWANYFIDEKRTLAAASQRLGKNWSMRFTHQKYASDSILLTDGAIAENNILSFNFGMGF
jgi:hypothetical protein